MNHNNPSLLDRFFRRNPGNPFAAKVHSHAIGQALMVHPGMGEQLIGAFLSGAVDAPPPIRTMSVDAEGNANPDAPLAVDADKIAFLNVSGALVARPQPGFCGDGPVSYVALRRAFDEAMADSNIQAIVFRLDSPGGMASGLFDLTDHIAISRGQGKKIVALVDDMAYSACYGIAAACDEIWVSRTGGVGSVGVVCYHVDQSEWDKKTGLKVTPIYAGDRKVDFSPHAPLSESALAEAQAMCDELRELFVASVASYRGIDASVVRGTEAGTFRGQAAIDVGFATHMGTIHDLLAAFANPSTDAEESEPGSESTDTEGNDAPPAEGPQAGGDGAAAAEVTEPVEADPEVARLVARGRLAESLKSTKLPASVKAALIELDAADSPVPDLISAANTIVDLCRAAGKADMAADLVAAGANVAQARVALTAARIASDENLVTTIPVAGGSGAMPAAGAWGEVIKRFGG